MIPIIDLFAGPGGLNEGFAGMTDSAGQPIFQAVGSFEMENSASDTLTLRGAFHRARHSGDGADYYRFLRGERDYSDLETSPGFSAALRESARHVHRIELGEQSREEYIERIRRALGSTFVREEPWALVGGPPCQAYSLVGRARRAHDANFEQDKKHFLYREYLQIISEFRPPVFVMENVKGLLSSTHEGTGMFEHIMGDLRNPAKGVQYQVHSLAVGRSGDKLSPTDFIIRSERYGVPQARHRVILLGIRSDVAHTTSAATSLKTGEQVSVDDAISGLPHLRSGVSRPRLDEDDAKWLQLRRAFARSVVADGLPFVDYGSSTLGRGGRFVRTSGDGPGDDTYRAFVTDPLLGGAIQHETRGHMITDLERYYFAASFALHHGRSPKLGDFPRRLMPKHRSATESSKTFVDRFRVQLAGRPSSTIVSHIAKDGHYFIHPDPAQMRSLTVREAARLQTFPDNYFFMGNRTQQYTQVGNAVPPLLARQIAQVVAGLLGASSTAAKAESDNSFLQVHEHEALLL